MIESLSLPASDADLDGLATLLCDAVDHGASVSFLPPLAPATAREFWRGSVALPARGATLIARDDAGAIIGCVQLCPARAPNQAHRAEVAKLLVHTRARRGGLGARLMTELDARARAAGFTLLVLDTQTGGAAEALYQKLGWTRAGVIPGFAVDATGAAVGTTLFYRQLG